MEPGGVLLAEGLVKGQLARGRRVGGALSLGQGCLLDPFGRWRGGAGQPLAQTPQKKQGGPRQREEGDPQDEMPASELQLDLLLAAWIRPQLLRLRHALSPLQEFGAGYPPEAVFRPSPPTPMEFFPDFFTCAIALSALLRMATADSPCRGKEATPKLADRETSAPGSTENGREAMVTLSRSASSRAPSTSVSGRTTQNSSPP